MTSLSDPHFTMPETSPFGFDDPFYDEADRAATAVTPDRESLAVPLCSEAPATINQEADNGNRR